MNRWQFWIDRGGTFTDCLGLDPSSGRLHVEKVLSSDLAPLEGMRRILGLDAATALPPCDVRMGTTLATNALLERRLCRTALVITRGFGDLLRIGTQARPSLFDLAIRKAEPLHDAVLEVDARLDRAGRVLSGVSADAVRGDLEALLRDGIESLAIVVLHSYVRGDLETALGELAAQVGFRHVSLSHEVAPRLGLLSRAETTLLDAALTPVLRAHVAALEAQLPGGTLRFMQSSGGLAPAHQFRGPQAILSGPAGGVVAARRVAKMAGASQAIGFDMGGTSTDVCRCAPAPDLVYEGSVSGIPISAARLDIHTVAAGGGSICRVDGRRLTVGPDSAGASPGPLCYGHPSAAHVTLSDVNLVLGRLKPDRFPFPLDEGAARAGLAALADDLAASGPRWTPEELAEGFLTVAMHSMADAIRKVTVARGHDARAHALVVFGGAGGQHACGVARALGIDRLLFHPHGGVLSALGMGLAASSWHGETEGGRVPLDDSTLAQARTGLDALEARGRGELALEASRAGIPPAVCRRLELSHPGTSTSLTVPEGSVDEMSSAFAAAHQAQFGFTYPGAPLEVLALRVEVSVEPAPLAIEATPARPSPAEPLRHDTLWFGKAARRVPVHAREDLPAGTHLPGPLIVLESTGTLVVEPGFSLTVLPDDVIELRTLEDAPTPAEPAARAVRHPLLPSAPVDPMLLEVFGNRFMSIAEQMGQVLRRTARSTNIRERLDFSCAVFDGQGGLVANAPHIPVHLGAMAESVRGVLELHPDMAPGDVFVTNDPARGGSHLPDITVVTPLFDGDGKLCFVVANRGHHSDVGGIVPGSMPPFSTTLAEEGVVLRALPLVRAGHLKRDAVLQALSAGPHGARHPETNLADLEAQIAANRKGEALLGELVAEQGVAQALAYMQHLQDDAALAVERAITALPSGSRTFRDTLDEGETIVVRVEATGSRLLIDFTGTSPEVAGNLNAPRAVTLAAVLYVLRALSGRPIPLNGGCFRPLDLVVPPRSLLDPSPDRAVAGGNVETSQRVVDVLLAALNLAAASQGTMNNLTFGDETFGYYETLAGGAGAGPTFDGASAVHTHMTNTRITDVEVLESRYPVRVVAFGVRRGSGGLGAHPGGDGLVRELELLSPLEVAILSERRRVPPFGLQGGGPASTGRNLWNGSDIGGKARLTGQAGDRIRIETPGGGGYGTP